MNSKSGFKNGIQTKAFIYMSGMFAVFLLIVVLLCITTFEGFVNITRKNDVKNAYKTINRLSVSEYSENSEILRELTYKYNLRIIIKNNELETVFSNMFPAEKERLDDRLNDMITENIESLENDRYKFISHKDIKNVYVSFVANLDSGYYLFVSIPATYVRDNIRYMVMFISLLGIVALFVSAFVSYILIRSMVRPIIDVSDVTEKITNMDFSEKCTYSQNDELGVLSRNVNKMSYELEKNIENLKIEIEKERKIDEMRKNLIMNVSHELKTPIFLIQSYAEGLRENVVDNPEDKNYYCEVIIDESERMNIMVKELLDLAKLETGAEEIKIEKVRVSDIFDDFLSNNDIIIKKKNITVDRDYDGVYLYADPVLVKRAVNNLIVNALDYVNDNGKVTVSAKSNEKECVLRVYNSGSHIPENEKENIWENFYKVEKSRKRDFGGTGIGLSIVKAILDSHKGKCEVKNEDDGVAFYLTFNNI